MIRVLNILTTDLCMDGISNSIMNYFRNIDKNKIQIDFIAQDVIETRKQEIEENNGKIFIVKHRKRHPIKYMKELIKIIKKEKYDIIHAHGSSAILCLEMIAAKRAGCKIRIAHSRNTKAEHKVLDKLLRTTFYRNYTHGFACGKEAGKWLFGNRKFEIINNGKNIDDFKYEKEIRKEMREKYNLTDEIVIGHVGTFNYQKNHEYLIKIFYELIKSSKDKYKLVLLGDGKLRKEIEEKVKELKIEKNVMFIGRTEEVSKWLQAMDIMVFPSRFEGFPNVLIEWQIAGLPSIISDKITPDVKVTDLVQFKSIEEEPEEWAKAIDAIEKNDRSNPKYIKQIKEAGYDIKENAKQLETIYIDLVNKRREDEESSICSE